MQQRVCALPVKDMARARQQKRYHAETKKAEAFRQADFQRRRRAAGIDREPDDESIDAFRNRLARTLIMYINDWEGCPLRSCQRMHGCMAPQSKCANRDDDPRTEEQKEADWAVARLEWRLALDKMVEDAGGRDAFEDLAEQEGAKRNKKS